MVYIFIIFAVFFLDRITKVTAVKLLDSPIDVIPNFFRLVYTENKGAAFSMFASSEGFLRFFSLIFLPLIVVAVLLYFIFFKKDFSADVKVAFAFIVGGALGNLYDRIFYGKVIDFLDFYIGKYHWPAFNVADIAVFLGTVYLIYRFSLKEKT